MGLAKLKPEEHDTVDPRIRVRLVTGGNRTGKDALVRHLLNRADGVVRAFILPEPFAPHAFGSSTSTFNEDGLVVFSDGSVCYHMTKGLLDAFNQLHLRWMGHLVPALGYEEVIVVVPASVNAAYYVTQLHTDPRLDLTYLFDGIDTVLEADPDWAAAEKRIAEADTVTIEAGNGDLHHSLQTAGAVNPFAEISVHGKNIPAHFAPKPVQIHGANSLSKAIGGTCLVNNLFNDRRTNQAQGGVIRAMQARVPGSTDIQRLFGMLQELREGLGDNLFRLRCTTHIRNGDFPIGFQMVGQSWTPPFYETDPGGPQTSLRIVARGLDPEMAFDQLRSCVWLEDDVALRRVPLF
jgi:G3E family GTPase